MPLLDPYAGSWTESEASHLLRRAGFGGSKADRQAMAAMTMTMTMADAVASLVDIPPADPYLDGPALGGGAFHGAPFADLPNVEPDSADPNVLALTDLYSLKRAEYGPWLRGHWCYRMRYSSQPFQEQLALFMHDHAPSGVGKLTDNIPNVVNNGNDGDPEGLLPEGETQPCTTGTLPYDPLRRHKIAIQALRDQNDLYRAEGGNSFEVLLLAILRDGAMLNYLDNFLNVAGKPQENLAREIMELFSLGVGNYSELDIFEIAKCTTGESFPSFACENDYDATPGFISARHEPGNKTVFGIPVSFDGTGQETVDVINLILNKNHGLSSPYASLPTTAVHMAWKLLRWFVSHDIELDPPDPIVLELAEYMIGDDSGVYPNRRYPYDFTATLGVLFRSQFFYDAANRYNMYKTPPDFIIGALKSLEAAEFMATNGVGMGSLEIVTRDMGMDLFEPPDVAGWLHGKQWLSSTALLARYNFGNHLGNFILQQYSTSQAWVAALSVSNSDHAGMVTLMADLMFHEPLTTEESNALVSFLNTMPLGDLGSDAVLEKRRKIGGLVHLMMTMPAYQLK